MYDGFHTTDLFKNYIAIKKSVWHQKENNYQCVCVCV